MDGWMDGCSLIFIVNPPSLYRAVTHHSHSFSSPLLLCRREGRRISTDVAVEGRRGVRGEVQEERGERASE